MSDQMSQSAFALSLTAGVLMLLGGAVFYLGFGETGLGYGMMGVYAGMMGSYGSALALMNGLLLIGLASGVAVTLGALLLKLRPSNHAAWGTLILIFSLLGFLGMDAFLIGALIGVIGGALALTWRPGNAAHARSTDMPQRGMS